MTFFERYLLEEPISYNRDTSKSNEKTRKTSKLPKRLEPSELEYAYLTDALIRNGIKASVQMFDCQYDVVAKSSKIKKETEDFLEVIGFDKLKLDIAKNCFVYGDAWCEKVYKNGKLIGIVNLNPARIDYAKSSDGKIAMDNRGNVIGYVQSFPNEELNEKRFGSSSDRKIFSNKGIFLKQNQIARFYFDTIGEGWRGIGLIEPLYSVILGKSEAEIGFAHVINKLGFPIVINYVGDESHDPSPNAINDALEVVSDLNYKTEIAVPYFMRLETLNVKGVDKLRDELEYFIEQEITGIGIPGPIATGRSGDTNRSTLVTQIKFCLGRNWSIRKILANMFYDQVLTTLAKTNNWNEIPKIVPKESEIDKLLIGIINDTKEVNPDDTEKKPREPREEDIG